MKRIILMIAFILVSVSNIINAQFASNNFSTKIDNAEILATLLGGQWNKKTKAIKWVPTKGDVEEFNAQIGDGNLYTIIDTTFELKDENTTRYYIIFHTAPMIMEEGQLVNSNNCHVCTVNIGYMSLTKDNDSLYIDKYRKNFARHGNFGAKTYKLSFINFGNGYEFLKVDDSYEGMGTESVVTYFYQDGDVVLSMISKENNSGNRNKNEKGYYEFNTAYSYDKGNKKIKIAQTGFKVDEKTGRKIVTNKTKTLNIDGYTMQF